MVGDFGHHGVHVASPQGKYLCHERLCFFILTRWRHDMETLSLLLALFASYPSVTVGFQEKGSVTRTFFFSLIKVWTSCWANWWIVGIWDVIRPMWRHLNELIIFVCSKSYQRIWIFSTGDVSFIFFAVMQVISGRYKLFTQDELCSRPKLNHKTMCL